MFKRNTVAATALSAFVFMTLCLLASAVTAQAQAEPQQGAINTSRSNIKNTSRTGVGRFDPLTLNLKKASGEKITSRTVADSDGDGTLADAEGAFNFGPLPEGQYVLTITVGGGTDGDASRVAPKQQTEAEAASAPSKITVTLDGAKGGSIKKDLALTPQSPGAATTQRTLDSKISSADTDLSGKKPAGVKYEDITFETDGKSEVKGAVHDIATSSIRNAR